MKHTITILLCALWVCSTAIAETSIMVISDPHVLDTALFDQNASFSGDPKLNEHSLQLFDSAVARIMAAQPDLLIIPGDLTKDGEMASHMYVAGQLQRIEQNGTKVYVVPGNHDLDNPSAYSYLGGRQTRVANLPADSFPALYNAFGYGEAVMRMQGGLSYMAYPANGLAIIALNSAMPNTTSRQSAGGLTEETLQWAEQAAAQAHSDGRAVIGVMHHNIVEHFDGHARFASTYIANTSASLPALEEVQQRLVAAGFGVMLTGHFHIQSIQHVITDDGELFDIATGAVCAFNSPIRTMVWNDSVLSVTSDTIGLYDELKMERNKNTTAGAIRLAANKGYPMLQDSLSMFPQAIVDKMNLPDSKERMIVEMDSFLLEPFTVALNSLALGDENLHPDGDPLYNLDVYIDCKAALDAYINYMLGSARTAVLTPGWARLNTAVSAAKALVNVYIESVLWNYVDNSDNVVADNVLQIPLAKPQSPIVGFDDEPTTLPLTRKVIRNNRLLIIMPDGRQYDATGTEIKP